MPATTSPMVASTRPTVAAARTHVAISSLRLAKRSASSRVSTTQTSSVLAAPQETFCPPMRRSIELIWAISSSVGPEMLVRGVFDWFIPDTVCELDDLVCGKRLVAPDVMTRIGAASPDRRAVHDTRPSRRRGRWYDAGAPERHRRTHSAEQSVLHRVGKRLGDSTCS